MKNHFALFIFALLSFTEFALGQPTGSVRGIVRDKNTQEIIENATVFLNDTLKKNRTNEKVNMYSKLEQVHTQLRFLQQAMQRLLNLILF